MGSGFYGGDFSGCNFSQILGSQLKDRVRRSGCCPDGLELKKVFIQIRFHGLRMTQRRDAADREPGRCPDEIRIGPPDRLPGIFADPFFIDAVRAAGQYQDRLAGLQTFEYQGLDDLSQRAAGAVRGFPCRTRGLGVLDDREIIAETMQHVLDFLCRWGEWFLSHAFYYILFLAYNCAMPSEKQVYISEAERYEALISREDYQNNIPRALDEIVRVDGLDVIDLGAGTGRLAVPLAARARSMRAFDISHHMLTVTCDKFKRLVRTNNLVAVADHRSLPSASASADLVISGWSVSYLAVWNPLRWREELGGWLMEARRVLRRNGIVILLESLGTGNESPQRLPHLENVHQWLDENEFQNKWIRTDYRFESLEQAIDLAGFFFGEEIARKIQEERLVTLPECTGVWWRQIQ